ncbi:hypothetical protein DL767_003164 [Monosporascus sp. MG133]|nr:hypothetical protein DL767_003164 [Monosporascus sp. MG133]
MTPDNPKVMGDEGEGLLLLFGGQALRFDTDAFKVLRTNVFNTTEQPWIFEAIRSLPGCWKDFTKEFPIYNIIEDAPQRLVELEQWFRTGSMQPEEKDHKLPNIILTPLVVIVHLVEYMKYLDMVESPDGEAAQPRPSTGTLGFCTGLLSAFAVALSKNRSEAREYGATAVRLAMLIGGVVDAQGFLDAAGPAKALATACNTHKRNSELTSVLQQYPESYVSVDYDENRTTVTTSFAAAEQLQRHLRATGIVASEIGLYGRFHHKWYLEHMESLIQYCDTHPAVCFPDASRLVRPTWCNRVNSDPNEGAGAAVIPSGSLHAHALQDILAQKCDWYHIFEAAAAATSGRASLQVVSFGPERCVPSSAMRKHDIRITHMSDVLSLHRGREPGPTADTGTERAIDIDLDLDRGLPEARKADDVAVIGMSIKVAGADDVDEFWELLCHGSSQHKEVPGDRLSFENVWREKHESMDPERKWYGNFVDGHDVFDHKFFKKSAREIMSTDPQQRHMLQVAYQAVEQSGYFRVAGGADKKIGCFIGVCSADYENNAACHQPNAFTAIGNLKSFIAGKISHYFGWLGPSLCIDSACSSSLVAVHQACRAVQSGECSAALAGGANIMTNSLWFQNLAAASFLSPTGQCKPFDANADGYCRGEGFAAVLVKKMSQAIADGDQILGTIAGSAVLQNQNCTPVFVPNAPSLTDLFQDVVQQAQLDPKQITVVEAHGTGTQVGDPAEYQSIKNALGLGVARSTPLALGSVKGLVGHTECASGAVSLIKTLLMIQQRMIPPQVSFSTLNPSIAATPGDNIDIVTKLTPWDADGDFHAALINNYGASGSNASMVVTEAPKTGTATTLPESGDIDFPFQIFGIDDRAIRANCARLGRYLASNASNGISTNGTRSIANIAFNISRQANPNLDKSLVFSCRTVDELSQKLKAFAEKGADSGMGTSLLSMSQKPPRPVILCFGGQVKTFVGLDRGVYDSSRILRMHLHDCDSVCVSIPGAGSIFPSIFQTTPIGDPVRLQTSLFAMQYACARSWIDCGVIPAAVVGHSFGELVALCVSGALSLSDALKMVVGRATVIRELWGEEKGAMMAVEGDLDVVERLLATSGGKASIACFNGPRSFTLAGTGAEIDVIDELLTRPDFSGVRSKRLSVTNAFHSALVEPLVPKLLEIGRNLVFREPRIPLERATKTRWPEDAKIAEDYVACHMREPVYFSHAIQRLAKRYPSGCIFLEAGSNSTITGMASRALGSPRDSHFQALNITGDGGNGRQMLTSTTLSLWKEGLRTTFWPHHRTQTYEYTPLMLPPYQFEKSRHWLEMKAPPRQLPAVEASLSAQAASELPPLGLFSFIENRKGDKRSPLFRINTQTEKYRTLVSGHKIANTAAICPATLIVDMAIEALTSVRPNLSPSQTSWQPQIHQVSNLSPICLDETRTVMLAFDAATPEEDVWDWSLTSSSSGKGAGGVGEMLHVTGQLVFTKTDDVKLQSELKRYERLVGGHQHCAEVLAAEDADDIIHGARNIYRAFAEVVDYPPSYRGVQRLVGKGNESAGRVVLNTATETWLDTHLSDSFSQVGGIYVNCMTDCDPDDMYIAVGFEKWVRVPMIQGADGARPKMWDVLARHERVSEKAFLTDIFVFDSASGRMQDVILGVNYHRVSKRSMGKTLARLTPGISAPSVRPSPKDIPEADVFANDKSTTTRKAAPGPDAPAPSGGDAVAGKNDAPRVDVADRIRLILADISGLEPAEIADDIGLADIGIDSLMGMEVGRELEGAFKTPLMGDELASVVTFRELVTHVAGVLGVPTPFGAQYEVSEDDSNTSTEVSTAPGSTAATSPVSAPTPDSELQDSKPLDLNSLAASNAGEMQLAPSLVFEAFEETKRLTDNFIADYHCAGYIDSVLPKQTQLCTALVVEACEELGIRLRSVKAGGELPRIPHVPQHGRLVEWLYKLLEHEARLIDVAPTTGIITRTHVAAPARSSAQILADLLKTFPDHGSVNRLVYFAGSRLADVLRGDQDGIKLIFGTDEGRKLVTGLYGDSLLNNLANAQMRDVLTRLVRGLPKPLDGPLRIMELGAGTGGTTRGMVPMLAKLGIPIEYTFTDLSGSFVAAARKTFGREYPFMKFRVHDIEKPPAADLPLQHIVIASNAIHATHSIRQSVSNIRKALRPDGFLLMLEMTEPLCWVDMIFGLFEGWWLFDDGRRHAIAHQTRWRSELQAAGYGRVDWTDGWRPEIQIQRVIIAQASVQPGFPLEAARIEFDPPPKVQECTTETQQQQLDRYVRQYTEGFDMPTLANGDVSIALPRLSAEPGSASVAVTGATGSLGAHLVAHLASLSHVKTVYCLNRRSTTGEAEERQAAAMLSRGIEMNPQAKAKLCVVVIDATKAQLGLETDVYRRLAGSVTHIVHNAWPMTGKRPVAGLEAQFSVMRNLIDLARNAAVHRVSTARRVTFQFISSIAVMGHHPLVPGNGRFAPESRATARQLLPNGYAHAKWVCERMLDQTLHRFPGYFRAAVVRPGQIAGSSASGYWNENEHLSFLVKSSQTLRALPALEGDMCWTPVDKVAGAMADLLLLEDLPGSQMAPVYHIDNPVRQPWRDVLQLLAQELGVPLDNIVPFSEWVHRVRQFPGSVEDNPALRLLDFLDDNFERMSCGGLLLETKKACEHSPTLAAVGPVSKDLVRKYINWWKTKGFLHP